MNYYFGIKIICFAISILFLYKFQETTTKRITIEAIYYFNLDYKINNKYIYPNTYILIFKRIT